ncbi:MAG: ATP-binding cassette domain-containing protein [Treponema sp.]|nr:ATP-binding cassette domain-containing protein [Treponema sp.]
MEPILQIKDFTLKNKGEFLINNFSLELFPGSLLGIIGPTGCGKTSLLNCICDFALPDGFEKSGFITKNGNARVSRVFQENRLLENLTVVKNVMLPLENIMKKSLAEEMAEEMVEKLNIKGKSAEIVKKLSGGEKQRCAIARALAFPSKILLMDEPFSAQDEVNKKQILSFTRELILNNNMCGIVVSHNRADLDCICEKIIEI